MPQETPPRLEFSVDVTEKEYVEASLIAARRIGSLRLTPVIILAAAAISVAGLLSFSWFASPLLPIMLCVIGPLLAVAFFAMEPGNIRRRARRDYQTYKALMKDSVVRLYADDVRTETALVRPDRPVRPAGPVRGNAGAAGFSEGQGSAVDPSQTLPARRKEGRRAGISPSRLHPQT